MEGAKNLFTGGIDLDSNAQAINSEDYRYALNVRNGDNEQGKFNIVTNTKGNTSVPYTQPAGDNEVLGSYEDTATGDVYYFVYNSNSDHQIRRYNADTQDITLVCQSDVFDWASGQSISHINLVDNKLLYWTDTKPRKINVEKAVEDDKAKKWEIYIPDSVAQIRILNNGALFSNTTATGGSTANLEAAATAINATGAQVTAEVCDNYISVEQNSPNNGWTVVISSGNGLSVPVNFYPTITEEVVDAAKYPQACQPTIEPKLDADTKFNYIDNKYFQFATRVVYDDFERSVLSPYSDINLSSCAQNFNYIEVDFTELRLNNTTDLPIIRAVEVYFRQLNVIEDDGASVTGNWYLAKYIERSELWDDSLAIGTNTFNFYNNGSYTQLDNTTANRQFDAIPIEPTDDKYSIAQEFFDDRIGYGNFVENYERPCMEVTPNITFEPYNEPRFNLTGLIRIYNSIQFSSGDPGRIGAIYQYETAEGEPEIPYWGGVDNDSLIEATGTVIEQKLPEGGWPVYAAGTDIFGISKQIPGTGLSVIGSTGVIDASTSDLQDDLKQWYDDYNSDPGGRGDMRSVWELKNVPPGKYVIRVASHWCSFGDQLGKGDLYDLNNGQSYQRTSTNVIKFVPYNDLSNSLDNLDLNVSPYYSAGEGDSYTEFTVEINADGSFDIYAKNTLLASEPADPNRTEIYCGDFLIEDLSRINLGGLANVPTINGYLYDNDSSISNANPEGAIAMEEQLVSFTSTVFNGNAYTDHNGYFYFKLINETVFATASSINGLLAVSLLDAYVDSELGVYLAGNGDITQKPVVSAAGTSRQIVLLNSNPDVTQKNRTTVQGRVVDGNGNGVGGASVVIERNGRQEQTDSNGDFSIVVYGDKFTDNNNRIFDNIIINSPQTCRVEFSGSPYYSELLLIDPFDTVYNNTSPYAPASLNNLIAAKLITTLNRHLKAGGRKKFAFMHVDEVNRRHNIYTDEGLEIYIPFTTEDVNDYYPAIASQQADGVFNLGFTVGSTPPTWADKLYVLRTKDLNYGNYIQFPLSEALYVQRYDADAPEGDPNIIETTFETRTAREIYLGLNQAIIDYSEFETGSKKAIWDYVEGDRVRFIRRANGQLYEELYDLPILGQRDNYLIVEAQDALGKVEEGTLVEVYRKVPQTDTEFFYEIHTCIDIQNGQYVTPTFDVDTGDAYRRNRTVPIPSVGTVSAFIEDNSVSDLHSSQVQDIGRINIDDNTFGRLERTNAIRFSNKYIAGTKINGLSAFEGLNVVDIGRNFGDIQLMRVTDSGDLREVLLTVFENRALSFYVGSSIITDLTGSDVVSLSNEVLGTYRVLKGDYGTVNPESAALKDGRVYWWDNNRKKFIRYSSNGLDAISDVGLKGYCATIDSEKVIGTYDDYYDNYISTFNTGEQSATLSWGEEKNKFISFYSFTPERYGTTGELILSFVGGAAWLHDTNSLRNNFYGVQYNSQIEVINNVPQLANKIFRHARVQGSKQWYFPQIITTPNASYPTGMNSRLAKNRFSLKEGDWWADFLRDINDPNPIFVGQPTVEPLFKGRRLRGTGLIITLENDSVDEATLRMLECYTSFSEQTNP